MRRGLDRLTGRHGSDVGFLPAPLEWAFRGAPGLGGAAGAARRRCPSGASVFALAPQAGTAAARPAVTIAGMRRRRMSERERVADELRRVREAVRDARAARAAGQPLPAPPRRSRTPGPMPPDAPPRRRRAAAAARQRRPQRSSGALRDALGGGGLRGACSPGAWAALLARVLDAPGGLQLAPGAVRQRAARLHRRAPGTHPPRTTTRCSGIHGRHMGEIDERHLILQEELVAHVHDLVKRIDLVLAEAERAGWAWSSRCATCARACGSSRSGSPRG